MIDLDTENIKYQLNIVLRVLQHLFFVKMHTTYILVYNNMIQSRWDTLRYHTSMIIYYLIQCQLFFLVIIIFY